MVRNGFISGFDGDNGEIVFMAEVIFGDSTGGIAGNNDKFTIFRDEGFYNVIRDLNNFSIGLIAIGIIYSVGIIKEFFVREKFKKFAHNGYTTDTRIKNANHGDIIQENRKNSNILAEAEGGLELEKFFLGKRTSIRFA